LDPSNWKWKNICVFGIKRICRKGRNLFPLDSSSLSWAPNYIALRWINISLLTITSKTCEALLRCQSYRFIMKWIALLNRWLSCKVDSCGVWFNLSVCPDNGTKSLWSVSAGNKSSCFFQLHTPVKLFFNNITTFKTKHGYQLQPEDIRWCALKTTSPYFDKLVKQTQRQGSHWNLWTWAKNRNFLKLVFVSFL